MFKIRLARSVEHARSPGNGRGPRRKRERHVLRQRPEYGIKLFTKLRRGERDSFRAAVAGIVGLRAGRDVARRWNRCRWQEAVFR